MLTLTEFQEILKPQHWRFGKTQPKQPHWYTLMRDWEEPAIMLECAQFMRDYGFHSSYFGQPRIYFRMEGYRYWTMDELIKDVTLINRAAEPEAKWIKVDDILIGLEESEKLCASF